MPITDAGFTIEDAPTRLARMRAKFEELSGLTPNWDDEDEFVSILMTVLNAELQTEAETPQAIWDAYSPNNATGRANQNLAAMALLEPITASASRAVVSLSGTSGVVVPAGKIVRHSGTKTRWTLLEDGTIPGDVIVESATTGPVTAAVGTLTEIVTPVLGWSGSTNAAAAALGRLAESDAELRRRRVDALGASSTGTVPAINTAVLAVDGISGVKVVANNTGAPLTIGAYTVADTRVLVMVLPDPLTTGEKAALAGALARTVAAGNKTVGPEACSTTIGGTTYNFLFAYADVVPVSVFVSTTLSPGYTVPDVEDAVNAALADYFAALAIGGDVLLLPIYGRIADITGIESVYVTLNGVAENFLVADSEIAQLGTTVVA